METQIVAWRSWLKLMCRLNLVNARKNKRHVSLPRQFTQTHRFPAPDLATLWDTVADECVLNTGTIIPKVHSPSSEHSSLLLKQEVVENPLANPFIHLWYTLSLNYYALFNCSAILCVGFKNYLISCISVFPLFSIETCVVFNDGITGNVILQQETKPFIFPPTLLSPQGHSALLF